MLASLSPSGAGKAIVRLGARTVPDSVIVPVSWLVGRTGETPVTVPIVHVDPSRHGSRRLLSVRLDGSVIEIV